MSADSRITYTDAITNEILRYVDGVEKVYHVKKVNLGISYWGLAEIQDKSMLDFLTEFEETQLDEGDSFDEVAEELKNRLEHVVPRIRIRMGLHLAGYEKRGDEYTPRLRHIFHERWHPSGEFTNEDSNIEWHREGERIPFRSRRLFPVLFNGDNAIANCLFNYIPAMTNGRQRIRPEVLTLDECLELAELVVSLSIQRLNYYVDTRLERIPKTVGGKIFVAKITPTKGFEWVKN